MTKTEFKEKISTLLDREVMGMDWDQKLSFVRQIIVEVDKAHDHDETKKGKPWTDNELRLILQTHPTKENIMLLAKAFRRGYGSIEQIFRWAASAQKIVDNKRSDDRFVQQIKRIAKEVGWRAT